MRQLSIVQLSFVAVTAAVLCLPVPAIAQGFQFGAERESWGIQFDKQSIFPCYRWNSHSSFSHFHPVEHRSQRPRGDRGKSYYAERNWDVGRYWVAQPSEKRRPRCIGLWESQR